MLKSLSVPEKMYAGDANVFAFNIIYKYKNGSNNSHPIFLTDLKDLKGRYLPLVWLKLKAISLSVSNNDDISMS